MTATQKKVLYTWYNGGPDGKHFCVAPDWHVLFKFTPIPALPGCLSIKSSLRSTQNSVVRYCLLAYRLSV